jgi:putative transposase
MKYNPDLHHRRSIRLRSYDYSKAGAYFITICVHNRECLFGDIDGTDMRLNETGKMVAANWDSLTTRFPKVELDAFVVMPNHIHDIIVLTDRNTPSAGNPLHQNPNYRNTPLVGAPLVGAPTDTCERPTDTHVIGTGATTSSARATTRVAPTTSLGAVVGAFKSITTVEFVRGVKTLGWPPFSGRLWQRNYYEHIIRDEVRLNRIRHYIMENPSHWAEDRENPALQPQKY